MRRLEVMNLGIVEYDDGLDLQEATRVSLSQGRIPERFYLLEHPPVVTIGRNSDGRHVLLGREALKARGIDLWETGRGGDVTFHGPGQIVGYPQLNLDPDRRDVRRYVRDLEEVLIRTLSDFDVKSGRIPGLTGVWIGDMKIAAIGVRISRWLTSHGFAFNVRTNLGYYDTIVPCGIQDRGVTTLEKYLGGPVDMDEVRGRLVTRLAEVFERETADWPLSSESVQVIPWRRAASGVEVLAIRRTPSEGGFWQPVTGRIEPGEAPAETAIREAGEETGLSGDLTDLEHVRDFRISPEYLGEDRDRPWVNREHAFALEVDSGSVRLSKEHEEWVWLSPEKARELYRWNGNRRALERLERRVAAAA